MWAPAGLTAGIAPPSGITLTGPRTQEPQNKEAYSCGSLDANFNTGHLSLYPLLKGVRAEISKVGIALTTGLLILSAFVSSTLPGLCADSSVSVVPPFPSQHYLLQEEIIE